MEQWKKENSVGTIHIRDATVVVLDPKQRFFLDQTRSMELRDMERHNMESKRIMEVVCLWIELDGPEKRIKIESQGFLFSKNRGTPFSFHLRYYVIVMGN